MKRMRRPVSLLLGTCLLAASAGCYTAQDYAVDSTLRLSAGMSMDEVQDRLGEPDLVIRGDPGTETVIADDEANIYVKRAYRTHWGTPKLL